MNDSATLDARADLVPDCANAALARIELQREHERLQQERARLQRLSVAASLNEREQQVCMLIKVEKMSYQHAADHLGISKTRVYALYKRASEKLKNVEIESNNLIES